MAAHNSFPQINTEFPTLTHYTDFFLFFFFVRLILKNAADHHNVWLRVKNRAEEGFTHKTAVST